MSELKKIKKRAFKTKFNWEKDTCIYSSGGGWCKLPKGLHCASCLRLSNGDKACEVEI